MDVERSISKRLLICLLIAAVWLAAATAASLAGATGRTAVVIVKRLNLRPTPGTDAAPIATLEKGDIVTVSPENTEWWKVSGDDRVGYISRKGKFLSFAPDATGGVRAGTRGDTGRPARELQRQLAERRQSVAAATRQENQVLDRLHRADRALADSRARLSRLKADIDRLENRIQDTSEASGALHGKIQTDSEYVKQRLVALYKMGRLGDLQLLVSAGSISELQRRRTALSSVLEYDRFKLDGYYRKAALLDELTTDLTRSRKQKQAVEEQAQKALQSATREKAEKQRLLEKVRQEKSLQLAALSSLKQSARELDQTVAKMTPRPRPAPQASPRKGPKFPVSKGLLNMPVRGKITSLYGPYRHPTYKVTNFNGGIDIRAGHGEPVAAVWQGVVAYSDWFKGYGNLIIVNHGDSYHTLYAHLAERFKKKGDPVEKGEILGTVGETGPVSTPGLHFQVRHHGKSLDPLLWIDKG